MINLPNRKKGSAIVVVIMIFCILAILSTAFISVSHSDAMQSINGQKSIQAYDTARTGVEIAVKKLNNTITAANASNTYFSDISEFITYATLDPFSGTLGNAGSYDVSYKTSTDLSADEMIKISSTGTVGGVTRTTALTLKIACPSLNPSGWINNGWIINDGYHSMNEGPVVFKTKKNLGHAVMKTGNNADTTFKAPSIHFLDTAKGFSLEVNKNTDKMTLEANLISFKEKVLIQNDNTGKMYLDVFKDAEGNSNGLLGPAGTPLKPGYGVIYLPYGLYTGNENSPSIVAGFQPGFYFFKGDSSTPGNELNLDNPIDRNNSSKMQLITDAATIDYLTKLINSETNIGIRREKSIWSKN